MSHKYASTIGSTIAIFSAAILISPMIGCGVSSVVPSIPGGNLNTGSGATPTPSPSPAPTATPGATPSPSATPQANKVWTSQCSPAMPGVTGVKYCVYQNDPNPQQTIWFMHGLGDSEQVFLNATKPKYESYLALLNGLPPTKIITFSFGMGWLLTTYGTRTQTPLNSTLDTFSGQIVPFIENMYHPPKPYILMGHSMGGFNTSTLCTTVPSMWSKCVMLNAMLPTCDPFSSIPLCNPGPGMVVKGNFDQAQWNGSKPLMLLAQAPFLPKTFVTACTADDFGLFDGPKAWADQASSQGFNVTWSPKTSNCDHYHWPADEVVSFLSH